MIYLQWLLIWVPSIGLAFLCRIVSPFLCMFVTREMRTDTVKRLGKITATLPRDNLIPLLWGFNTHDNNTDEWWYGCYNEDSIFPPVRKWTQEDYDNSAFIRWFCRVMWLQRNSAYGFNYAWFSKPKTALLNKVELGSEDNTWWLLLERFEGSFQLQVHVPVGFGRYNSINIGWKEHSGKPLLFYAGRVIGPIRRTK